MNTCFIAEIEEYCHYLIQENGGNTLPFHNWEHTQDVVANVKVIAKGENIDAESQELLIIAAYFHDVGYIDGVENHEKISCVYATEFLNLCNYSALFIEKIRSIILATVIPQEPETLLQKIICDADLAHLGKTSFNLKNEQLRKEWSLYQKKHFTDKEWIKLNMQFLNCHHFHTTYAKEHYSEQQEHNRAQLSNQLKKYSESN